MTGDVTAITTVLSHIIYSMDYKVVTADIASWNLKQGIYLEMIYLVDTLEEINKPLTSKREKIQMGMILKFSIILRLGV